MSYERTNSVLFIKILPFSMNVSNVIGRINSNNGLNTMKYTKLMILKPSININLHNFIRTTE